MKELESTKKIPLVAQLFLKVLGITIILFSIVFLYLLIDSGVFNQESANFVTTKTTQTNSEFSSETGSLQLPSYTLLWWPLLFILGGVFVFLLGTNNNFLKNILGGLTLLLISVGYLLFFKPEQPFSYMVIALAAGALLIIGSALRMRQAGLK